MLEPGKVRQLRVPTVYHRQQLLLPRPEKGHNRRFHRSFERTNCVLGQCSKRERDFFQLYVARHVQLKLVTIFK
jgi:hypothetical protein